MANPGSLNNVTQVDWALPFLKHINYGKESDLMRDYDIKDTLIEMLKENHGENMLNVKTKELLNKLELI